MGTNNYIRKDVREYINDKLSILRDFGIVTSRNEYDIECQLIEAVKSNPNSPYDLLLDGVTKRMIKEKLDC